MMYTEMANEAKSKGEGEQLTLPIKTWKTEGDSLIGKVTEVRKFEGGKFETECKQYLFDTDDGLVSTIFGTATDKQLEDKKIEGRVLWIEYKGKDILEDGRQVNKFEIKDVTPAEQETK